MQYPQCFGPLGAKVLHPTCRHLRFFSVDLLDFPYFLLCLLLPIVETKEIAHKKNRGRGWSVRRSYPATPPAGLRDQDSKLVNETAWGPGAGSGLGAYFLSKPQ